MASLSITNKIIDGVVHQASKQIYQNCLIKNEMPNYTRQAITNKTEQLIFNAVNVQRYIPEIQLEYQPQPLKKDTYCLQSIRKIKMSKYKSNIKWNRSLNKSSHINKAQPIKPIMNDITKSLIQESLFAKRVKKNKNNQNNLIKIGMQEKEIKMIPDRLKKEEKQRQQKMRNQKIIEQNQKRQNIKQKETQERDKNRKNDTVRDHFQKEKMNPQNRFAYDQEGKIIFYNVNNCITALKKQYPPSVNYTFDNLTQIKEQSQKERPNHPSYHKMSAAKGEVFASSVLKTVNLSKISMTSSINNNHDPIQFMIRNDLFNNNHSRQTSSIPYLQIKQGTTYTQKQTNQSVGIKSPTQISHTTPSHYYSARKSQFKKFTHSIRLNNINNFTQVCTLGKFKDGEINNTESRVIKSSYIGKRKLLETNRPKTTGNTGRITTANQTLVISLLQ